MRFRFTREPLITPHHSTRIARIDQFRLHKAGILVQYVLRTRVKLNRGRDCTICRTILEVRRPTIVSVAAAFAVRGILIVTSA